MVDSCEPAPPPLSLLFIGLKFLLFILNMYYLSNLLYITLVAYIVSNPKTPPCAQKPFWKLSKASKFLNYFNFDFLHTEENKQFRKNTSERTLQKQLWATSITRIKQGSDV